MLGRSRLQCLLVSNGFGLVAFKLNSNEESKNYDGKQNFSLVILNDMTIAERNYVLTSLARYWTGKLSLIENLPLFQSNLPDTEPIPAKGQMIKLPEWANGISIDGGLLIPQWCIPPTKNWERSWVRHSESRIPFPYNCISGIALLLIVTLFPSNLLREPFLLRV